MNNITEKHAFYQDLENIKNKIESMSKNHQIEILKIFKKIPSVKINENKSGVFVNLTFLPEDVLLEIKEYLNYVFDQEYSLSELEKQKKEFKNIFFDDNHTFEKTTVN
jgi:hypothetical protein